MTYNNRAYDIYQLFMQYRDNYYLYFFNNFTDVNPNWPEEMAMKCVLADAYRIMVSYQEQIEDIIGYRIDNYFQEFVYNDGDDDDEAYMLPPVDDVYRFYYNALNRIVTDEFKWKLNQLTNYLENYPWVMTNVYFTHSILGTIYKNEVYSVTVCMYNDKCMKFNPVITRLIELITDAYRPKFRDCGLESEFISLIQSEFNLNHINDDLDEYIIGEIGDEYEFEPIARLLNNVLDLYRFK